jgi:two-component system, sensor histidine kinase and response regulator
MNLRSEPVKFLLVDDTEDNLIALEALLRRDGLELLKARSGDDALELLLVHDVALALLDVHMPEMDGFALAELMRGAERSRHVPIIFVTAAPQEAHREFRGYDAGAVDFLFKPLDSRILRHKTETFYQLHRQRQQLEETLKLAETFMAAVGHDLKNPLNAIVLGAELILANPENPQNRETAERLRSSSHRMARLIDDLFDLARARLGGGVPIITAPTDLAVIVRRTVGELETAHAGRKITFSPRGDARGVWDGDRLAQVASNLLANALRHGAKDTPIAVSLLCDDEAIELSVHNEGQISPDVQPHLFDPFHPTIDRPQAEGLGLGLFIVHQIVSAHGGTVHVDSSEAEGTTFRVKLPKTPPAPTAPPLSFT